MQNLRKKDRDLEHLLKECRETREIKKKKQRSFVFRSAKGIREETDEVINNRKQKEC